MIFKKMPGFSTTPGQVFGAEDVTSADMRAAVAQWYRLYYQGSDAKSGVYTQRIPYAIVEALCGACFGEYAATAPQSGPKQQALAGVLAALDSVRRTAFQQALIGGEALIKPVPGPGGFEFCVISRPGYLVLGRGLGGAPSAVGTMEATWADKRCFTLYEKRSITPEGLEITSKLYESRTAHGPGRQVPLHRLARYAHLQPRVLLPPQLGLGLVRLRTPLSNCVDQSPDGVSIYAAAAGKIAAAARHEARCEDEYRLTRPRVIASIDLLRPAKPGQEPELPEFIVPIVDDEPASAGLTVYNPAPNQGPLEARMQQHLRDIENIVGLRRGMLSGVESAERTATEVAATTARYATLVAGLCGMWRQAVQEAAALCDALGRLYLGWDDTPCPAPQISFGDGVMYNADAEFERLFRCVEAGMLPRQTLLDWMAAHGG